MSRDNVVTFSIEFQAGQVDGGGVTEAEDLAQGAPTFRK
jgi:hypothetical protein